MSFENFNSSTSEYPTAASQAQRFRRSCWWRTPMLGVGFPMYLCFETTFWKENTTDTSWHALIALTWLNWTVCRTIVGWAFWKEWHRQLWWGVLSSGDDLAKAAWFARHVPLLKGLDIVSQWFSPRGSIGLFADIFWKGKRQRLRVTYFVLIEKGGQHCNVC